MWTAGHAPSQCLRKLNCHAHSWHPAFIRDLAFIDFRAWHSTVYPASKQDWPLFKAGFSIYIFEQIWYFFQVSIITIQLFLGAVTADLLTCLHCMSAHSCSLSLALSLSLSSPFPPSFPPPLSFPLSLFFSLVFSAVRKSLEKKRLRVILMSISTS